MSELSSRDSAIQDDFSLSSVFGEPSGGSQEDFTIQEKLPQGNSTLIASQE